VQQRLHSYAEQLVGIARARGERLNLARRDPLMSALLGGFARVRSLRGALLRADQLSPRARQRLAQQLDQAHVALNQRGHLELRALLDRVRLLRVDAALLNALFERTRAEPALAAAAIAPLVIDPASELPCAVLIPQQAFTDIVINLFRNALQVSLRQASTAPAVVGIMVAVQLDEITGIERVELRVRDRSPERLELEAMRGAYIEAGLGLTADLVTRYEGQLDVSDDEPGFSKAVILRLPGHRSDAT
jgi:hypothetical protein